MKGIYRIIGVILTILIFISAIGLVLWQWNIKNIYSDQHIEISNIIDSAVQKHSENGLLLPDIILIKTDSLNKEELSNSLTFEIKSYMRDRFMKNNNLTIQNLDIKPFYVLPDKPNQDGNYLLTKLQLEELKSHIDFLTKQVSLEVSRTKEEVGKDIDRLNTWMSIWIAVIGFLGIFVPIVVNLDVIKSADEAKENADEAKSESAIAQEKSDNAKKVSDIALTKIDAAQEKIKKVEDIEKKVDDIEPKIEKAEKGARTALLESEKTKRGLEVVHSINRLNLVDSPLLMRLRGKSEKIQLITNVFKQLHRALKNSQENYNDNFIRDLLLQFVGKLRSISLFKFVNASQTRDLNHMASIIEKALDDLNKDSYEELLIELENLIKRLEIGSKPA